MWTAVAALISALTFVAAFVVASAGRRRPVPLSLAVAFSFVVGFEAMLAPALSAFRAYARGPVLAAHIVAIAAAAALAARSPRVASALRRLARAPRALLRVRSALVLAPWALLGAMLAFVAAAYAPNNWDSMTYRLARIAHWIQHESVAPYPTNVNRQVALSPGAEYVLAAWQVIARSDRLANFLQLAAWAVASLAAAPLVRLAGAGRRLAPLGVVIAASVPMAVLQATSTQNDLVAAAACVAVIAACLPYLGRGRTRGSDAALLGGALAVATLVKPTVVVASAPFLLFALVRRVRLAARSRREARSLLVTLSVAAGVSLAVAAPDAAIRLTSRPVREANARYAGDYLYPVAGEAGDRALNVVRGVGRHFPLPPFARAAIGRSIPGWCTDARARCVGDESREDEDVRGNPLHVLLVLALCIVAAIRWRRLPRRGHVFLVLTCAAWLLFQLTFRHNDWITRLESPIFALAPLALVALGGLAGVRARAGTAAAAIAAAVLFSSAVHTGRYNQTRSFRGARAALRDRVSRYYVRNPSVRPLHDAALEEAVRRDCRRMGLLIGGDSWDYPLTWRAMEAGIETRHVFGADPWPCLVFVDGAEPAPAQWRWVATRPGSLFENAAYEAGLGSRP